jgi:hypothetical protein
LRAEITVEAISKPLWRQFCGLWFKSAQRFTKAANLRKRVFEMAFNNKTEKFTRRLHVNIFAGAQSLQTWTTND